MYLFLPLESCQNARLSGQRRWPYSQGKGFPLRWSSSKCFCRTRKTYSKTLSKCTPYEIHCIHCISFAYLLHIFCVSFACSWTTYAKWWKKCGRKGALWEKENFVTAKASIAKATAKGRRATRSQALEKNCGNSKRNTEMQCFVWVNAWSKTCAWNECLKDK